MELAKARDLRTLSKFLITHMAQPEIDLLYPEPLGDDLDVEEGDTDSDDDENQWIYLK